MHLLPFYLGTPCSTFHLIFEDTCRGIDWGSGFSYILAWWHYKCIEHIPQCQKLVDLDARILRENRSFHWKHTLVHVCACYWWRSARWSLMLAENQWQLPGDFCSQQSGEDLQLVCLVEDRRGNGGKNVSIKDKKKSSKQMSKMRGQALSYIRQQQFNGFDF